MVYSTRDEGIPLYAFNDSDSEVEINNHCDGDSDSNTSVDGAHFVGK